MTCNPKAVANYFLTRANQLHQEISTMKMQKLVYIAHGWNLAKNEKPLIEEPIEAWKYGPVTPSLFQTFIKHGIGPITEFAQCEEYIPNNKEIRNTLNQVMKTYGGKETLYLMRLTNAKGSPWRKLKELSKITPYGTIIENKEIKNQFTKLITAAKEKKEHAL